MKVTKKYVFGRKTFLSLPWAADGQERTRYGSLITKEAVDRLHDWAAEVGVTQQDLLEGIARCINEPLVKDAIVKKFAETLSKNCSHEV